jgi:hypothetical protein
MPVLRSELKSHEDSADSSSSHLSGLGLSSLKKFMVSISYLKTPCSSRMSCGWQALHVIYFVLVKNTNREQRIPLRHSEPIRFTQERLREQSNRLVGLQIRDSSANASE